MIDRADSVDFQLKLSEPTVAEFADGGSTTFVPAKFVPERANFDTVRLEGAWQVAYWPFAVPEAEIVGKVGGNVSWSEVAQPGKVFYYDPNTSPDKIPDWDRVSLAHIDPEDGAIIKRNVTVPGNWAGKKAFLRFEGIYPAGVVYFDGIKVGEQWSGLTPIEFDVTELATPGVHTVAIRLYRKHESVKLDMPRHALEFTGLCRAAFLHAVEPVHVSEMRLAPELADDYKTGHVTGEVTVRNSSGKSTEATVAVQIVDAKTNVIVEVPYSVSLGAGEEKTIEIDVPAGEVNTWNAEKPYLYAVRLRVIAPGQESQCLKETIGFRKFEMKDQRPLLNGNPVKFRGVNHLTFHPEGGMYTPEPWLRQCLTMMKRANVNAIRTHFFGPRELTDLCDELGIYLLQELPIDWGHPYFHESVHLGPVLHRMEACVRRDRNHPCVMVWSIGNENLPKTEEIHDVFFQHLALANEIVKKLDPTRPTMFPPPGPANKIMGIFETRIGDIADIHYSFKLIREFNETNVLSNPRTWEPTFETHTREELHKRGWSGVWFSSEYGIANKQPDLNGAAYLNLIADLDFDPLSGKNAQQTFVERMHSEWGLMHDDPTCLGGAYFCWIAAGAGDQWGWVRWGEDADWGILTGDLMPKPSFWALRELFCPVRFPDHVVWQPGSKEVKISIRNDYNGLDFSDLTFRLMRTAPAWGSMCRIFEDIPVSCPPGETVTVTLPMENTAGLDEGATSICRFIVLEPSGFRTIMADVLVISEENVDKRKSGTNGHNAARPNIPMPLGPDAVLD